MTLPRELGILRVAGYTNTMTKITRDEVLHLAQLSALGLSQDEEVAMQQDLTQILGYVEMLDELDTAEAKPVFRVGGQSNIWREDQPQQDISREELLQLAPDTAEQQVKVPKVL